MWFWGDRLYCKTVRPMLSDRSVLSDCDVGVLWPNGWMDQDETWHGGRPRPWPHCFRRGPSSPSPKGHNPNFRPMSLVAKRLDGSKCYWYKGTPTPWPRPHCVRWGLSSPKRGTAPNFCRMCIVAKRSPISAAAEHLFPSVDSIRGFAHAAGFAAAR